MKKLLLSAALFAGCFSANAQTAYFTEDFEWLAPWCEVGDGKNFPAADIVGTDQASTVQPQISKSIVDEISAEQALVDRGYGLMRYDKNGPNAAECIYIQSNYLKFGKTGFQGELILPAMESLGDGVWAPTLSFDWYSQRQGSGVFDPTELVVIVENPDAKALSFSVPKLNFATGDKAAWTRAEIPLTDAKLTKESRIHIRNVDSQLTSAKALRWHIDNIRLAEGVTNLITEELVDENTPTQYFTLQGAVVTNPTSGIYILRQGNKVSKVIL